MSDDCDGRVEVVRTDKIEVMKVVEAIHKNNRQPELSKAGDVVSLQFRSQDNHATDERPVDGRHDFLYGARAVRIDLHVERQIGRSCRHAVDIVRDGHLVALIYDMTVLRNSEKLQSSAS